MKVRVSLAAEDVEFLDAYTGAHGHRSRSAVLEEAVKLLRGAGLEDDYAEAWKEWRQSGDAGVWETTSADGCVKGG